jgi:hypothetical protein
MELHGGSICIGGEPESFRIWVERCPCVLPERYTGYLGPLRVVRRANAADGLAGVRFRSKRVRVWAAQEIDASATSQRSAPEVRARWLWRVRYGLGRGAERMPVLRCGRLRLGVPSQ